MWPGEAIAFVGWRELARREVMAILETASRKVRGYEEAVAPDSDLRRESNSFLFLGFRESMLEITTRDGEK